jgi:F-type H+-transporting ATPase subunit c
MRKLNALVLALMFVLFFASPALAKDTASTGSFYGVAVGAGIGCGITILGAGLGFGRIGGSALESMARQPETAGQIQTGMLIIAALLEGATFFSLIVCIIMALQA